MATMVTQERATKVKFGPKGEKSVEVKLTIGQFESVPEAQASAKTDEAFLAYINASVVEDAKQQARQVGLKFASETATEDAVLAAIDEAMTNFNPFESRRGQGNAVNKAKAEKLDKTVNELDALVSKGHVSLEDIRKLLATVRTAV